MGHKESSGKFRMLRNKEIGDISHKQLKSKPESSETKRSKHTQEEKTAEKNQTLGWNQ